jgi:multiple sugar transport system substrate-binding protein
MDRTQEQTLQAMTIIKSMLDQSMTWAEGGHIPAYLPTLNSAEYKALPTSESAAGLAASASASGTAGSPNGIDGSLLMSPMCSLSPRDCLHRRSDTSDIRNAGQRFNTDRRRC